MNRMRENCETYFTTKNSISEIIKIRWQCLATAHPGASEDERCTDAVLFVPVIVAHLERSAETA